MQSWFKLKCEVMSSFLCDFLKVNVLGHLISSACTYSTYTAPSFQLGT